MKMEEFDKTFNNEWDFAVYLIFLDSQTIEDFIWTNLKFIVSKLKVPTLNSKRSFLHA